MAAAPAQKPPHVGLVLAGLMMGILLAALDQTIVGTSLPRIVRDLGGFDRFAWLFSAYMLASTIVIPIAGKLSDLYGRRPLYLVGMGVFLFGSMLCGLAGSVDSFLGLDPMNQLIAARAVQGLGGGAIFPVAIATMADLFPPSERGKVGGLFGAVFGLSSVVGPFVGGFIVDNVHVGGIESWRWVFYVNLPVGLVAIAFVAAFFPRLDTRHEVSIDYMGAAALTATLLSGLMVAVLVQQDHAWSDPMVLGLAALALAMLAAFLWMERRAKDPIIALHLFRNPIFSVSVIAGLLSGAAMFTIISFMPTYLQGVLGMTATNAGVTLIPLSIGIVLGSAGSGVLMKRFGYKVFGVAGFLIAVVGYLLLWELATRGPGAPIGLAIVEMALLGLGVGSTIQTFIIATQNAVEKRYVGVTTSAITLFRTLGATIGVTVLGLVLNERFAAALRTRVAEDSIQPLLHNPALQMGGKVGNLPNLLTTPPEDVARAAQMTGDPGLVAAVEAVKEPVRESFAEAIAILFLIAAGIALVGFLVSLALKSIPMKTADEYHAAKPSAPIVE